MTTSQMNPAIQSILDQALDAAILAVGGRLRLFLLLGRLMLELGKLLRRPAPKGNRKGVAISGISYTEAINRIRDHLKTNEKTHDLEVPSSDRYWFAALHAAIEYDEAERETMLRHNVSWSRVTELLGRPDKGHPVLASLDEGAKFPTRRELRQEGSRRGIVRRTDKHGDNTTPDRDSVTVPFVDEPTDESFINPLKSLLSQMRQRYIITGLNRAVRELRQNRFGEALRRFELAGDVRKAINHNSRTGFTIAED